MKKFIVAALLFGFPTGVALSSLHSTSALAQSGSCVCYCGGTNWSPGATACMGGFKHVCVAAVGTTACGWTTMNDSNGYARRCEGSEHCR